MKSNASARPTMYAARSTNPCAKRLRQYCGQNDKKRRRTCREYGSEQRRRQRYRPTNGPGYDSLLTAICLGSAGQAFSASLFVHVSGKTRVKPKKNEDRRRDIAPKDGDVVMSAVTLEDEGKDENRDAKRADDDEWPLPIPRFGHGWNRAPPAKAAGCMAPI